MSSPTSKPSQPWQFINIAHPEIRGHLAEHRSAIHKQAARDTHARRRRAKDAENPAISVDRSGATTSESAQDRDEDSLQLVKASPVSLVVQIDAFASLPTGMTTMERFLLNHCTYFTALTQLLFVAKLLPLLTNSRRDHCDPLHQKQVFQA